MTTKKATRRKANSVEPHEVPDYWPLYFAALGLTWIAAFGYYSAVSIEVATGLTLIAAAVELVKPHLGKSLRQATDAGRWGDAIALGVAGLACVVIGAAGTTTALHAADAPVRAWESVQAAVAPARAEVATARADLALIPVCDQRMPKGRCIEMVERNAPDRAVRQQRLSDALASLARVEAAAAEAIRPKPGLPRVGLAGKIIFGLAIDFIIIVIPFAGRAAKRAVVAKVAAVAVESNPAPVATPKPNTGGWATRRARYGVSGRKPKRAALRVVKG